MKQVKEQAITNVPGLAPILDEDTVLPGMPRSGRRYLLVLAEG